MAPKVPLDIELLKRAFATRTDIVESIQNQADTPERVLLFNNIAAFVYNQYELSQDGPVSKRRRVDVASVSHPNGHVAASQGPNMAASQDVASGTDAATNEEVLLEIKDISVSAPQRKKYDLCFTKNYLYARASGSNVPVQGIVYPWKDIDHAFYLPVPEKSQVQHNYVLFPRNSYLPTTTTKQAADESPQAQQPALEPLVFTIPATAPKPGSISGPSATSASPFSDSYTTLFNWAFSTSLRDAGNSCQIVSSDPKLFHSVARQPYRPSEKAVHVRAFRGSKDGYLFFLPTGILWGFKKPLLFLPLDRIVALSYTSVLQRTFNIVVEYEGYPAQKGEQAPAEEIEFAMLDQEDYQGIDTSYVRRHGLADRSMAEQRKAKRELVENAKKGKGDAEDGEDGNANAGGGDDDPTNGMTELEKAQWEAEQQLQDEEDEEEEDYDPGSEGESEGSGSSSEEDDEEDDEGLEGEEDETMTG